MILATQRSLLFILAITFLISFTNATTNTPKSGFSLNLTFIDPENHHQNLTLVLDKTKHHIDSRLNPTTIRPYMYEDEYGYYVIVGLRTDKYNQYTLKLDTCGGLTRIQCDPCNPCFTQKDPLFKPGQSKTFAPVLCTDPFCRHPYRCVENKCHFDVAYEGGSSVHGDVVYETFHFPSHTGLLEEIKKVGFGCVHVSENYNNNKVSSGVFAPGSSFSSLAQQLEKQTLGRFSYCLYVPSIKAAWSQLRVGTDIDMVGPSVQVAFLLHYPDSNMHYLDLVDVTIDTTRLNLPPGIFARQPNGSGGCTIDTLSPSSAFIQPAWDHINRYFIDHFGRYGLRPVPGPATLCFPLRTGIESKFPNMTLHFRNGANLFLRPERIWQMISDKKVFCSTLTYHRYMTVIGAMQQVNTRFLFELPNKLLFFAPENCGIP